MLNFLIAFAVSFLGSIPLGSLNLTGVQIYLRSSFSSVIVFAFSAGIVEFLYSFIAIQGEIYISENSSLEAIFSFISIGVFFILGIVNFSSKRRKFDVQSINQKNKHLQNSYFSSLKKGLVLSFLNPQAIPFWLIISNFLKKENFVEFHSINKIILYCAGVATGTFFCLLTFALIIGKLLKRKEIRSDFLDKVIGSIFIGIGIIQVVRLFL